MRVTKKVGKMRLAKKMKTLAVGAVLGAAVVRRASARAGAPRKTTAVAAMATVVMIVTSPLES